AIVLGLQGDEQNLDLLLSRLNTDISAEFSFALALSRLNLRFDMSEDTQIAALQQAFSSDNDRLIRACLYGWYRASEEKLTGAARDTLINRWRLFGIGTSSKVDQYVNKLLKERTTSVITTFYNGKQRLDGKVQLSIELAKSLADIELTSAN